MRRLAAALLTLSLVGCSKSATGPKAPTGPWGLMVLSHPGAVRIIVDGVATTSFTPATVSLSAGQHQIGLNLFGYRDTTLLVSGPAGAPESLSVMLTPKPGTPRTSSWWQSLPSYPYGLAAAPGGPLFVSYGSSNMAIRAYGLDGALLGERTLSNQPAVNLSVRSDGSCYYAQYVTNFGWALQRVSSAGADLGIIYYYAGGNPRSWPGALDAPPCPSVGTNDTLEVLLSAAAIGGMGEISRYVGDAPGDTWHVAEPARLLQVDATRRRCFLTDQTDSVWVLSTGGQRLFAWVLPEPRAPIAAFALAPDGTLWLASVQGSHVIWHCREDGTVLGAWDPGDAVSAVTGLAVDNSGRLYAADWYRYGIVRYDP